MVEWLAKFVHGKISIAETFYEVICLFLHTSPLNIIRFRTVNRPLSHTTEYLLFLEPLLVKAFIIGITVETTFW